MGGNNAINYPSSAAALTVIYSGSAALTLPQAFSMNGSFSTTQAGLTLGYNNVLAGNVTVAGDLGTQNSITIRGNTSVSGNTTLGYGSALLGTLSSTSLTDGGACTYGSSTVSGTITLSGSASASALGSASKVYGAIGTAGSLTLTNATVTGNVQASGALQMSASTISGTATAASVTEPGTGSSSYGAISATAGNVSLQSSSAVSGAVSASGTISLTYNTIGGAVTASGTGTTSISNQSVVNGNVTVANGTLSLSQATVKGSTSAAVITDSGSSSLAAVSATGNISLGYGTNVKGALTAGGLFNLPGGSNTLSGTVTINGTGTSRWDGYNLVAVSGAVTSAGNLVAYVTNVSSGLQIAGDLTLGGTSTGAIVAKTLTVPNGQVLNLTGNITTTGAVSLSYAANIQGSVSAGSYSDQGAAVISGALSVSGSATMAYGSQFGSSVTVGGDLSYARVTISGNVVVGGTLTPNGWAVSVGGNVTAGVFNDNGCGGYYAGSITATTGSVYLCSVVIGNVVGNSSSAGTLKLSSNGWVVGCMVTNTTGANSISIDSWSAYAGATCCYNGSKCLPSNASCYHIDNAWQSQYFSTSSCPVPTASSPSPAAFNAVATGTSGTGTHLYTQLVNTSFGLDLYALSSTGSTVTTYSGPVKVELVNAGSGSCATTGSTCQQYPTIATVASSQSFSSGKASVTVPAVSNAYKDVCVRMTDTSNASVYGCSSGNFTIRPQSFTVTALKSDGVTPLAASSLGASGTPTVAASSAFKIVASSGASNYTGSPSINSASVTDFLGSPTAASSLLSGSFSAAVSGIASGTFTYAEVGYVSLGQDAVVDTSYTAGSNNQSNSDCISGSTSNTLSGGKYGCNIGSAASGSWGRFIPDHFALANGNTLVNRADIAACSASAFTYLGEDFKTAFTLVAQNGANQTTYNYAGSYAKLAALTSYASYGFASSAGTIGVGSSGAPSGSWGSLGTVSGGQAAITAYHVLSRAVAPVAPYAGAQITATPLDSDGVTSGSALLLGSSNFYYGRLGLASATGSSTASLQMPMQAYYYSSAAYKTWVPNGADSCTVVPAGAVALSRYLDSQSNTTSAWTTTAAASTLSSGRANLVLSAPVTSGGIKPGSVSVALNLGSGTIDNACLINHPTTTGANLAYLRGQNGNPQSLVCSGSLTYTADPSATATFGVYTPETVKTMYIRELY